jgi:hypothetical protein
MHPSTPLAQVQADDAVIGLQTQLFPVLEDPSLDHSSRRWRIVVAEQVASAIRW